jgi:hypothetical protein
MMMKKNKIPDLLFIPVSLGFLFLLFKNYPQYLDISMVDETGYMEFLRVNPLRFFGAGGYGPLYIMSYKVVYQFINDFVDLHYFAIISLTWLPSVALFYFLRSRNVTYFVAAYASWAMLCSSFIAAFDWWGRTAHYAVFFIFLMLIFTCRYKNQTIKSLLLAIIAARILAYVRPELNMASYFLTGFLLLYILYIKFYKKQKLQIQFSLREKIVFGTLLFMFLAMHLVWRSPTNTLGRARLYFALGQHYKFNTMIWNGEERKEFLHWEETFKAQFGNSRTLSDMYKNNPKETIKHVTFNIKHYFQQTFTFITELFFPKVVFNFNFLIKWAIILAIYLGLIAKMGVSNYLNRLKNTLSEHFVPLYAAFAFAVPSVMASFGIYPREHYFIMQLAFIYYLLFVLFYPLFSYIKIKENIKTGISIALIALLLFITPNVKSYQRYNNFYTYETPNYLPYIEKIRDMKIDTTVNFLTFEILPVYLGKNYIGHPFFTKKPFYDSIIVAQNINMIYMSDVIIEDKRNKADSSFTYFMNNYPNLGWQKLQLKDKHGYLILKKELY